MRAVACPNNGHKAWPAQARMGDNASAVVTTNVDNKKVFMTWHTYLQHVKQFWNPVDPRLVHLIAPTLVNWLTRHEPRVVFLPPPPTCSLIHEAAFLPHGSWAWSWFQVHMLVCFIPSLIMLDSGCAPPVPSKTMTIRRDHFGTMQSTRKRPHPFYFRGMKREECVAPIPGRPCLTGRL